HYGQGYSFVTIPLICASLKKLIANYLLDIMWQFKYKTATTNLSRDKKHFYISHNRACKFGGEK
ncbi:MAG: hypothetical protein Q4G07_04965, partial [Oscillospiraceae bacterium]|nr:hypothetical protein [Oscillospiraceae bacterium]